MKGFHINIEQETRDNTDYRRVLYTAHNSQLVVMCLKPGEEIGEEVHELDQFIRFEVGSGTAVLDGVEVPVKGEEALVIPQGMRHNVINSGTEDLKLYTVYSPPAHKDGTLEKTKADEHEEHFDGVTTE